MWNKRSSGQDDDAMVQQVLGAVADLKGKKPLISKKTPPADAVVSPLAADAADFGTVLDEKPAAAALETAAVVQADSKETIAMKSFNVKAAAPKPAQENFYLKGLDLAADDSTPKESAQPVAKQESFKQSLVAAANSVSKVDAGNVLTSDTSADEPKPRHSLWPMSWKPKRESLAVESEAVQQAPKKDFLGDFLGMTKKTAPRQAPKPSAAPADRQNPYMLDLQ
eukprot:gnl/TRDRNA2_/TRDRNA2_140194_c1_seq2.p2 gnl/TRDRNA2_/TRDRNA2_140194_c1~~gnl/TRDRNA2_/TRDRNA2_140194_c1_seq2.p2  ORF type:complete len:224 (-),score=77.07 gnl/TRDRNA2_/TRDRNA2_140194_c1_seq2:59-730(-)